MKLTADYRKAGCEGKARFRSQKKARKSATNMAEAKDAVVAPYKCRFCHWWHVGQNDHDTQDLYRNKKRKIVEELAWFIDDTDREVPGQQNDSEVNMDTAAQVEMPRYKSHKLVHALKIADIAVDPEKEPNCASAYRDTTITPSDKGYGPFRVTAEYMAKHRPEVGGYYVVYEDGYQSYSPAAAFEGGYTLVGEPQPVALNSNEGKGIKGYRDLSTDEVALINEAKDLAEQVRNLVERAARLPATPLKTGDAPPTTTTDPYRAVSIARTELQTGFMWLIRSIARPTTF